MKIVIASSIVKIQGTDTFKDLRITPGPKERTQYKLVAIN